MAQFDEAIPPGGAGNITLKVDTTGFTGKVHWKARIFSNDPTQPVETIALEGTLNPAIVFWPTKVLLKGSQKESVAESIRIEGKLNKPLKIEPLTFDLDSQVKYQIVEIEPGKAYEVQFASVPGSARKYLGFLKLKTGYVEKPQITIPVWGDFAN